MDRLINLTSGQLTDGNQNQSHMRLYQISADRVRRGRITSLVPAFSPELAAKKVDAIIAIDTTSAEITEIHRSANPKPINYEHAGRRLAEHLKQPIPEIVNKLANEYINGFNDRLSYTGRQKAETRAKNAQDAEFFIMGFNASQRRLKASKPKTTRKKKAKVA